jgi:uridine kinase
VYEPVAEISRQIAQRVTAGNLVLVGGLARQGKSTLTAALRHELVRSGLDAQVLALDGFLLDLEDREPGVLGRYDRDSVNATLTPWLRNNGNIDIDVPIYDRLTRRRAPRRTRLHLTSDSVLIVDGVPALLIEPATQRRIVRVFVDGDEAMRERRIFEDLIARGMSEQQARSTSAGRAEDETPIVAASASRADMILSLDAILARLAP